MQDPSPSFRSKHPSSGGELSVGLVLDVIDRPPSHSQLVYDRLKQAIREGQVTGGSLVSESDLARQLGVSTTPVHEAVVRLASEGFVETLPRRGVRVVNLAAHDVVEIFEVREALEAEVVRLLLQRGPTDGFEQLQSYVAAAGAALAAHDYPAFNAADVALHDALARATGNHRLQRTLNDLRVWVQRIRLATVENAFRLPGRPAKAQEEHRRLVWTLQRGDAEAEDMTRRHISTLKEEIVSYMELNHLQYI
jgi:DNA-binding GntR family transcriptional regulator